MPHGPIETTVIGSYPFPGWLELCSDRTSEMGPDDVEEAARDATLVAVMDQVRAGLDVISDGEQGRFDFNLSFYAYLDGLELEDAPRRRWGPPAHDQRGKHRLVGELAAPRGLGAVEEFERLRELAPPGPALKASVPGPYTLAGRIEHPDRWTVTDMLIPIVARELVGLVEAGCERITLAPATFLNGTGSGRSRVSTAGRYRLGSSKPCGSGGRVRSGVTVAIAPPEGRLQGVGCPLQRVTKRTNPVIQRTRRAPSTRLSSLRRAAQRAVWERPQSGDTDSRSPGTCRRHARIRSSTSSGDSRLYDLTSITPIPTSFPASTTCSITSSSANSREAISRCSSSASCPGTRGTSARSAGGRPRGP